MSTDTFRLLMPINEISAQCFPEYSEKRELFLPIKLTDIQDHIQDENFLILERLGQIFRRKEEVKTLHENNLCVDEACRALRQCFKPHGDTTELRTYGDVRQAARTAFRSLRGLWQSRRVGKGVDPTVLNLVRESYDRLMGMFQRKISQQRPPPEKAPDVKAVPAPKPRQEVVEEPEERLQPPGKPVTELSPEEIYHYVDVIGDKTWGMELEERMLLKPLGIPWNDYRIWKEKREDYEVACTVLRSIRETGKAPANVQVSDAQHTIIAVELRRQHPDVDDAEFQSIIASVGLIKELRRAIAKKKKRQKAEEKTIRPRRHFTITPSPWDKGQNARVIKRPPSPAPQPILPQPKKPAPVQSPEPAAIRTPEPAASVPPEPSVAELSPGDQLLRERQEWINRLISPPKETLATLLAARAKLIESLTS